MDILHQIYVPNSHDLFLYEDSIKRGNRPLMTYTLARRLKKRLRSLGIDDTGYSPHSLRCSGVSMLARSGWRSEDLFLFGGWSSDAALVYLRSLVISGHDSIGDVYKHTFSSVLPED